MNDKPQVSHWFTGESVHCPYCVDNGHKVSMSIYTDGKHEYAACAMCERVWNTDGMVEVQTNNASYRAPSAKTCPNCGCEINDGIEFCSEGCRYEHETGKPRDEY